MTRSSRPRRRLPPAQRRRQLIEAAVELYGRRPLSVDDITEAADVSRALFYRYFANPAELFATASRSAIDGLVGRLTAPREGTPDEQLRAGLTEFLDFVAERPAAYVAVIRNSSAISAETGGLVNEVRDAVIAMIKQRASLPDTPMLDLTLWCWTAVTEEATLRWLNRGEPDQAELVTWLIGQLYAMVTATLKIVS